MNPVKQKNNLLLSTFTNLKLSKIIEIIGEKEQPINITYINKSGLRVITWRLVEQLTSQNDVASGGDSPDGTIGFVVIYCDWDNNGKQDPLNLLPWEIGYEFGDPLRIQQLQKFVP